MSVSWVLKETGGAHQCGSKGHVYHGLVQDVQHSLKSALHHIWLHATLRCAGDSKEQILCQHQAALSIV